LRPNKIKMKISWCFRSDKHAQYFSVIRSFFETMKKRGQNLVASILSQLAGYTIKTAN
jgi:hypothetical protein